jgi:hypothetical protein
MARNQYQAPEGLNPFRIYYSDGGSEALRQRLQALSLDEIKGVIAQYTEIPRKMYKNLQDVGICCGLVIQAVGDIATRSQAFGDYRLD